MKLYLNLQLIISVNLLQMSQIQIKADDVVRLILQYLHQNRLYQTFDTLQKQAKIAFNTISARELSNLIMKSEWDIILQKINTLMLSQDNLFMLFQIIIDDLIEKNKFQAAKFLIDQLFDKEFQAKYRQKILRLEYICQNTKQKDLYKKPVTQQRKAELCRRITKDVHQQPKPSRLLTLLTQAIKYQVSQGSLKPNIKTCLYEGKQYQNQQQIQSIIKSTDKTVQYSQQSRITALSMSHCGQYLALGSIDGLIQIYDTIDYNLHTGLTYQNEGIMLFHQHAITCIQFNEEDQMLISSDTSGTIKIWGIQSGKLLRKFNLQVTGEKVNVVGWGFDPSHIFFGYQQISLYGLRSSLMLKQYNNNHQNQYLHSVLLKNNHIFTCSTTGTLKIFNYGTQQQLFSLKLRQQIVGMIFVQNQILLGTQRFLIEFNTNFEELRKWPVDGSDKSQSALLRFSCINNFIYECIKGHDKKCRLNVRNRKDLKVVFYFSIEAIALLTLHPKRNLMVTYDQTDQLKFWRSQ